MPETVLLARDMERVVRTAIQRRTVIRARILRTAWYCRRQWGHIEQGRNATEAQFGQHCEEVGSERNRDTLPTPVSCFKLVGPSTTSSAVPSGSQLRSIAACLRRAHRMSRPDAYTAPTESIFLLRTQASRSRSRQDRTTSGSSSGDGV